MPIAGPGHQCSLRLCEYGDWPREPVQKYEGITNTLQAQFECVRQEGGRQYKWGHSRGECGKSQCVRREGPEVELHGVSDGQMHSHLLVRHLGNTRKQMRRS